MITPPRGSYLIGYGDRLRGSSGVRDELTATALVLDDGAARVAVLAVDMLCLHEDVVARVRERARVEAGVEPEALLLACSHTHAGPIAWAGPASAPWRRRLVDRLVAKLAGSVAQAQATLAPAELALGHGEARVAVNRRERQADGSIRLGRDPEGFVDRSVGVLQLREPGGAPRATLVNFACHPAVLSPRNRRVSAVLATLGAGLEPVAATPVAAARDEVALPIDLRRGADGRVESYVETGARKLRVPRALIGPLLRYAYPWRPRQRPGADGRPELPMEVQALRVGDVALVAHAAETFSAIGSEIKARAAAPHAFFVGHANGSIGYLATAEAHAAGGYEVEEAPLAYRISGTFDPGAAEAATERSLGLVEELFRGSAG